MTSTIRFVTLAFDCLRRRKIMMPQVAGSPALKASFPKSLSNVRSTRCSAAASTRTSSSLAPGASILLHATSWPSARSASTALRRKFSLARNRMKRSGRVYRIDLLRPQHADRMLEAGEQVLANQAQLLVKDRLLRPASAMSSNRKSTLSLVPRTTGLPTRIFGLISIRSWRGMVIAGTNSAVYF